MVHVSNLSKRYGDTVALSGISFSVKRNEIVGFLGPNAAGKTTTMRIISGFLPPDTGYVSVGGYRIPGQSIEVRRQIGYLPENASLYTHLTVRSYLDFMSSIRDVPSRTRNDAVEMAMKRCGISSVADRPIRSLSRGFRQRVGLAQAIVHDPPVLILDEPTVGLDPKQIHEVRNLIRDLGSSHTVILSSHILPEVSAVCDRVVIIHKGSVVAEDTTSGLVAELEGALPVTVSIRGHSQEIGAYLASMDRVELISMTSTDDNVCTCKLKIPADGHFRERMAAEIVEKGWGLQELSPGGTSLEDVFLELTREDVT